MNDEIKTFNDNKPARISRELYELEKARWRMGVLPTRLLMMVSQSIGDSNDTDELFPLEFPLHSVFKYLNIEKNNNKYEELANACAEFRKGGLDLKTLTKTGRNRWIGISFIGAYEFTEGYPSLKIEVNPKAKQFFCNLKQYALSQPKFYLRLKTEYQNWFYPYLKMRYLLGSWEVEIKDLIFMLYLENSASYTTDKNANRNIFERIIGIKKPKEWKYNKNGKNTSWEYLRDKNGEFSGTLAAITRETDINVSAYPILERGKYTSIHFEISLKSITRSNKVKHQSNDNVLEDMGKPTRYGRTKKLQTVKDLFSSVPLIKEEPNPLAVTPDIPHGKTVISAHVVVEMARLAGKRVTDFAKQMGYVARDDGNWEK